MNTRDMWIFTKIADYRSITRTAEDIRMTQPAVSSTLKRIEEEIGYPLFIRRGKWLILNDQGKIFYDASKEFLGEIAYLHEGLQIEDHHKEEIVIKIFTHSDKLFALLGEFAKNNPGVRIILRNGDVSQPENFRKVDFQISLSCDRDANAQFIPLEHRGALFVILPRQHAMADKNQLNLCDLIDEKFVFLRDRSPNGMEDTYQVCLNAGIIPLVSVVTDNNSNKYSAIRRGCGIGLVFDNELSLTPFIKDCKLLPVSLPLIGDWLCLTWYKEELSESGLRFLDFVEKRITNYGN